jgi:hypothetical protein
MVLVIRSDDAVDLYVHAGDPAYLHCNQADEVSQLACMAAGVEAFEVRYSARLRAGVPLPPVEVIEEIAAPVEADAPEPVDADPEVQP